MPAETKALSKEIAALAKDFARSAAGFKLPKERLLSWKATLAALPRNRRDQTVTELVALASKFKRLASAATVDARAQLAALAAVLLAHGEKLKAASGWKTKR